MIKFFRNVRKNLLTEGKMANYLKYAIGEIVLVVIGILIALQVNNWNEGRKDQLKSQLYREKIIDDLNTDLRNIDSLIDKGNEIIKITQSYFQYFDKQNNVPIQTLVDSCIKASETAKIYTYTPINYTFKEMQSSGNLGLLNEEQRAAMFKLSNSQDFFLGIFEKVISQVLEELKMASWYLDLDHSPTDFYTKLGMAENQQDLIKGLHHLHNALSQEEELSKYTEFLKSRISTESNSAIQMLQQLK